MSTTQTTSSTETTPKAGAVPVRAPKQERPCSCAGGSGECDTCKKKAAEPILQRKAAGPARANTAPPSVNRVLDSPGRPLDAPARSFMEPRFGRDFGGVRVHTDPSAAESARAVDAHAYTVGQHIVFDSGKFDPHSGPGRNLLAHELAHTVQQHGLQRSSENLSLAETPEYRHLEAEANSVAHSAISGAGCVPPLTHRPAKPLISRAAKIPAKPDDTKKDEKPREWEAPDPDLKKAGVKKVSWPGDGAASGTAAFNMGALPLPAKKGDVLNLWKPLADANQLQAIVESDKAPFVALKQDRPSPASLRKIWQQKVGWTAEEARGKWKDAALKSKATDDRAKATWDSPKIQNSECQVDHMVELQFGGSSDRENLQMLDGDDNMQAGGDLYNILRAKYTDLRQALDAGDKKKKAVKTVIMLFDDVKQPKPTPGPCARVENWVRQHANEAEAGESVKDTKSGDPYPIYIGKFAPTSLIISGDFQSNKKLAMPIRKSTVPENKSAATLIPGFLLDTLYRHPGKGKDTIDAALDTREGTQLPITLKKEQDVALNVAADGKLSLPTKRPNLAFHYPYLSEGVFHELKTDEDGALTGSGTIKPTPSFLPTLDVRFDKEKFELAKPIPKDKLKLPIPGVKITKAEVLMQLAPQFKPAGEVEFALDAGKRHLLDGKIAVSGNENGLVLQGDVQVSLPGVDNAAGHIEYSNHQWSGKAEISTTQLQSKLKYIKGGSLVVGFSEHGMSADGKVQLRFPGVEEAEAQLIYESNRKQWMFKGKAIFKPPGLEQTEINIYYDGEHFEGQGKTGFTFHGIHGDVTFVYRDEKLSGSGDLTINKGKAKGVIHVKMRDVNGHPVYSGDGTISYQITENLVATGGIEINEKQEVRLKGELAFPKPIRLFDPLKGDYEIFDVGVSIPIPGASIGPIGLKARIDGSLSAGYQVGPGELRNAKIAAAFNPLEDKPDVDVDMTATLYVGGSAYISGKVEGSIVLDAVVASVRGGLAITARASLDGHASSEVHLHYAKGKFEADANFELLAALALTLALDAFVEAEAGVWRFKVKTRKDWNLASFHYDTGLQFGMKLKKPMHYSSDDGVKLPSASDIEWIKPDIHPVDMLEKIFAGGGTEKEE
jgi:hypothetical protein